MAENEVKTQRRALMEQLLATNRCTFEVDGRTVVLELREEPDGLIALVKDGAIIGYGKTRETVASAAACYASDPAFVEDCMRRASPAILKAVQALHRSPAIRKAVLGR